MSLFVSFGVKGFNSYSLVCYDELIGPGVRFHSQAGLALLW